MSGVDTIRGIGYQQAQAVLAALDVLDSAELGSLRVEGVDDVVDLEIFAASGSLTHAKQVKTRGDPYTWGTAEIVAVLRRWAALPDAAQASFEFLTDGRLGPTGENVQAALVDAGAGSRQSLATILDEDEASEACIALTRARVRVDPTGVGALLSRAERQVAAMLPDARTASDAREQAENGVNALFRLLFDRSGDPDPDARIVTREELARTLGVPADQPASSRWRDNLRSRYLEAVRSAPREAVIPAFVEQRKPERPTLRRLDVGDSESLDISALLDDRGPMILSGRTGSGKSTAAEILRRDAASRDRVVLVAHAETYLPARLDALAADAISGHIGYDCPSATGREALADSDVTLVIDGVSEVPAAVWEALHDDLLAPVAASRGASVILLGRDLAVLREVFPSSVTPTAYAMSELDGNRRLELVSRILADVAPRVARSSTEPQTLVAQVERAIGEGSGNPLLFTMALTLIAEGVPFTSRATLYDGFVRLLAERSGAVGLVSAVATLGVVYARLLDEGRRYADPVEWYRLLAGAASELERSGLSVTPDAVDTAVRRCGLVIPLGYTQTLAPIHDSFADYMAGAAHARHLVPFPSRLERGDQQRVLFAAEIGGVDADLAALVARDQPFLAAHAARFDRRALTADAPIEVELLLRLLVPAGTETSVALSHLDDGRVVAMRSQEKSSWVEAAVAREMLKTRASAVLDDGGPLAIAARLWQQDLRTRLSVPDQLGEGRPRSLDEACSLLEAHARETERMTRQLIDDVAPAGHTSALAAAVGPCGLSATVHQQEEVHGRTYWPASYQHITSVVVVASPDVSWEAVEHSDGRGTVDDLIHDSPLAAAAKRVREAINTLTSRGWL